MTQLTKKPTAIVLLARSFGGKDFSANYLTERLSGFKTIGTGLALRTEVKQGTDLGKKAEEYMDQGLLAPDDLVFPIFENLVRNNASLNFVVNGIPRHIGQLERFEAIMSRGGYNVIFFYLNVSDEERSKRIIKRQQEESRSDDNPKAIAERDKADEKVLELVKFIRENRSEQFFEANGDEGSITAVEQMLEDANII